MGAARLLSKSRRQEVKASDLPLDSALYVLAAISWRVALLQPFIDSLRRNAASTCELRDAPGESRRLLNCRCGLCVHAPIKPQVDFKFNRRLVEHTLNQMDDSGMSEKIGKLIAARLKELGKGQAWLAENACVSVNAVSKWTKTGKISRGNVARVAELLGLSADELMSGQARAPARQAASGSKLDRLDLQESELVDLFRQCGPGERELIIGHARLLSGGAHAVTDLFSSRNKT